MIDMKKVYESVSEKEDKLLELEDYLDVSRKLVDDYWRERYIPVSWNAVNMAYAYIGSETLGDYRYNMTFELVHEVLSEHALDEETSDDISYYLEEFFERDTEDSDWFNVVSDVFSEIQEYLEDESFLTKEDIADIEKECFNSNNLSASSYLFLYNKLKRLEDNDYDDFF